jgi:hypothetical protein
MADHRHHRFGSYDPKLVSILDVVGSYFVSIYYNDVYVTAKAKIAPRGSLTDSYVGSVKAIMLAIKTDKNAYHTFVKNLHQYFRKVTSFATLAFGSFVDKIVRQFIPPEYYDLLKNEEKDETLGSIITDLAANLGSYATEPKMLRRIIDNHDVSPGVTIRMLQDKSIEILLAKRGDIHNGFLRKIGQARDTVSVDLVNDLKQAIRKLVKEKSELKADVGHLSAENQRLLKQTRSIKAREAKFLKLIKMLKEQVRVGKKEAALSARVPPPNGHGETDPLDFKKHPPYVPPENKIGEVQTDTPVTSDFFAPPRTQSTAPDPQEQPKSRDRRLNEDITSMIVGTSKESGESSEESSAEEGGEISDDE